jgi:hypothetical protein
MPETTVEQVLANRNWAVSQRPFPHAVVDNVFQREYYDELVGVVRETIAGNAMKNSEAHDIMIKPVTRADGWPLSFFYSAPWQQAVNDVFQLPATGYFSAAIHHHVVGSANGYPHNDLRSDWLAGTTHSITPRVARRPRAVRGVAVLIYLANPPWRPGDGGETGLYRSPADPVDRAARFVAPINNRLLAFPCSPMSFHAFRTNRRMPRNSIVMWTHQSTDDLIDQWKQLLGIGVL